MLKTEHRGCHGNGGEDERVTCIFVHHLTEVKTCKVSGKSIFFFFPEPNGGCLMATYNDS